jgi:hypothetical protein
MDPKWVKFVTNYKALGGNRIQLLKMKGLPCGDFSIVDIYAPNNLLNIFNSWELMKEEIPRDYNWLSYGDLNTME